MLAGHRSPVLRQQFSGAAVFYEFRSKATDPVLVREHSGQRLLHILGKPRRPRGFVPADNLPAAIAALRGAVPCGADGHDVLRMLETAMHADEDVTWEPAPALASP